MDKDDEDNGQNSSKKHNPANKGTDKSIEPTDEGSDSPPGVACKESQSEPAEMDKQPIRKSGRLRPYSTRNAGLVLMELMRKDAKQHTEEACLRCGS